MMIITLQENPPSLVARADLVMSFSFSVVSPRASRLGVMLFLPSLRGDVPTLFVGTEGSCDEATTLSAYGGHPSS
jgi:hypothetical protein